MSEDRDLAEMEASEPMSEEELVGFLERDQLVSDKRRPVPRAPLGPAAAIALWSLRVFAIVLAVMVIYTFAAQVSG
jgi:hypothetical protein